MAEYNGKQYGKSLLEEVLYETLDMEHGHINPKSIRKLTLPGLKTKIGEAVVNVPAVRRVQEKKDG